jgi:hypothetical protein
VAKGVFTVILNDGSNHFSGGTRFISVQVKAGTPAFVDLGARSPITAAPYAHYATTASTIDGVTHAADNSFGFGTSTPGAKVHALSTSNAVFKGESSSTIGAWLQLQDTSAGGRNWSMISSGSANGEGAGKLLFNDQTGGATRMTIDGGGRVGIGTSFPSDLLEVAGGAHFDSDLRIDGSIGIGKTPGEKIDVAGNVRCNVLIVTGGSDVSESYDIAAAAGVDPRPGMVVSIDPAQVGKLRLSSEAYDHAVAGIVSGGNGVQPGLVLNQSGTIADGKFPVANVGRVWCCVDADANGAIAPGDLLTTAPTPGHAMKASDLARSNGAIIGKAMSRLEKGKGMVLVLVGLQ